ncbi:MAG TPA: hypothetical protein VGG72_09295 [Bryobacteraceae bacterium]|jgi:hypothetical protein
MRLFQISKDRGWINLEQIIKVSAQNSITTGVDVSFSDRSEVTLLDEDWKRLFLELQIFQT